MHINLPPGWVIANCAVRGAQSTHGYPHLWYQLQTQDVPKTTLRFDSLLGLPEPIESCYSLLMEMIQIRLHQRKKFIRQRKYQTWSFCCPLFIQSGQLYFLGINVRQFTQSIAIQESSLEPQFQDFYWPPLYRHGWLLWWLISQCIVACTKPCL